MLWTRRFILALMLSRVEIVWFIVIRIDTQFACLAALIRHKVRIVGTLSSCVLPKLTVTGHINAFLALDANLLLVLVGNDFPDPQRADDCAGSDRTDAASTSARSVDARTFASRR